MARRDPPMPPNLRRRGAVRRAKFKLLIYSEGKNTEPHYIKAFAQHHGNSLVEVKIVAPAGVPMTVINSAKSAKSSISRSKNSFENYDQVWAIFVHDEHPEVSRAIDEARSGGVEVAYSNPCFEVWLLLHHGEFDAPDDRHKVQKRYATLDKNYDPNGSKTLDYPTLHKGYDNAKKRAARMRNRREEEDRPRGAPYTDMDILTALIVENGKIA